MQFKNSPAPQYMNSPAPQYMNSPVVSKFNIAWGSTQFFSLPLSFPYNGIVGFGTEGKEGSRGSVGDGTVWGRESRLTHRRWWRSNWRQCMGCQKRTNKRN
ncbi:hypothetical protein AAZX31_02G149600 [Glycine max]